MKPSQCVFNFNNIKILNMTGNSSFNIGEISNKEFSNINKFNGLNSTIGDNSESKSIMEISSFDPEENNHSED